ncbi:unnamed protein product [Mucor hiemalis]
MMEKCLCFNVIHPDNPHKCMLCNQNFSACLYINELQRKITRQAVEIGELNNDLALSKSELERQKNDYELLNMKYIHGMDRVLHMEQQKESADLEIEELSARLFEEANNMVANEKRKRKHLEELLRHTEDQLKAEQSQLYELRSRIEADAVLSPQQPFNTKNDVRDSMSVAQIMQLHNEIKVDHQLRYTSETIQYGSSTRLLFEDIKAQQSVLVNTKNDSANRKSITLPKRPTMMQSKDGSTQIPNPSDSAYFSTDNNIPMEATRNNHTIEESDIKFAFRNSLQYLHFQNFIEQQQKYRKGSIPSLMSDISSNYRDSVDSDDTYLDSSFQSQTNTMEVNTLQTPVDFMSRVEVEDIEPCLQFGRPDSHMCVKTLMEHMKVAPCFIEPITLKEARNLPSPTNAISSAYYRPLWEKLVLSYIPPHQLECSACGNKCRASANITKHNEVYYRFRLKDTEDWLFIDQNCRDRLVAVCDFYNFINNIRMGLYKQRSLHDLYLENIKLRLNIFYSRTICTF